MSHSNTVWSSAIRWPITFRSYIRLKFCACNVNSWKMIIRQSGLLMLTRLFSGGSLYQKKTKRQRNQSHSSTKTRRRSSCRSLKSIEPSRPRRVQKTSAKCSTLCPRTMTNSSSRWASWRHLRLVAKKRRMSTSVSLRLINNFTCLFQRWLRTKRRTSAVKWDKSDAN